MKTAGAAVRPASEISSSAEPLAQLKARYRAAREPGGTAHLGGTGWGDESSRRVVGFAGWTVPIELVHAAGLRSAVIAPGPRRKLAAADEYMETSFTWSERAVFDRILSGEWDAAALVVLDRSWAAVFAYLAEVRRLGIGGDLPPVHLFDEIRTPTAPLLAHRDQQIGGLVAQLERIVGAPISAADLADAKTALARRRSALARLAALRRAGWVSGADALEAIGAGHSLDPVEHARLLDEWGAAVRAAPGPQTIGPRVVLTASAPLEDVALHRAIEASGAVVVGEDDGWGSRAGDWDASGEAAPLVPGLGAVTAAAGSGDGVGSPGTAFAFRRRWLLSQAMDPQVDAVVVSVPLSDRTLGWDVPRLRAWLSERGIPLLVLDADVHEEGQDEVVRERCARFLADAVPGGRRGASS